MSVSIEPVNIVPVTFSYTCNRVQITIDDFQLLATSATCRVYFYNGDTGSVIKVQSVTIPEDIYAEWGTDDQFIIDYVLQTLNLTPSAPEV